MTDNTDHSRQLKIQLKAVNKTAKAQAMTMLTTLKPSPLNPVEPANMVCEFSIQYHPKFKTSNLDKIINSDQSQAILRPFFGAAINHLEQSFIMALNRINLIIGVFHLSTGGQSGTVIDPKIVFQSLLLCNAASFIICHNHPSGNLKPSEADITITKKLKDAGTFLDLPLLDHLILTSESYYSFADDNCIL